VGVEVFSEQWVAIFLAFQSQCWHTNDQTGHSIPEECNGAITPTTTTVKIVAALVNPEGNDVGLETVTLINLSPSIVDLSGWFIADKNKNRSVIGNVLVNAGATSVIELDGKGAQLGNSGGIITLLNPKGIKQDGVSYTKEQALSGWTVLF
jgi:hypothetical protein